MKWFEGSIPAAIQEAKSKRVVFIVYISGDDDMSHKMDESWTSKGVEDVCRRSRCVGLKLHAQSESCTQFSQIYPIMCVPSTFFIGDNGVPLEVTPGHIGSDELVSKIEAVIQMHSQEMERANEHTSEAASKMVAPQATSQQQPSNSNSDSSLDTRVAKARELIAQKQRDKALKEKEHVKHKENERRTTGQQQLRMKQQQAEDQMKEDAASVKKDHEDDRMAREKVKAQIAQDRADRAAKFQVEKAERDQAVASKQQAKQAATDELHSRQTATRRESAVLQFRLPDGSSFTHQFESSAMFTVAREFVTQHVGSSLGAFRLSTMFPKREFLEEDMSKSFLDLGLVPTAVVMIMPVRGQSGRGFSGGVVSRAGLLWTLLSPFLGMWRYVSALLFAAPAQPRGSYNQPEHSVPAPEPSVSPSTQTTSGQRTRPQSSYGLRKRQQGNMHRLTAEDSDDEDGATWNGNSTQQL